MILLKITNASELVAAKIGQIAERLTPDGIDHSLVEDQVVKRMIESLSAEGIEGEVFLLEGLEAGEGKLILNECLKVSKSKAF